MAAGVKRLIPRCMGARCLLLGALSLFFCLSIGMCQSQPRNKDRADKYDLQAETKIKGAREELKLFDPGTRRDSAGEGNVVAYVCPKLFQDELEITFSKGDDVTITGPKAKREESEVILAVRANYSGAGRLHYGSVSRLGDLL